MVTVLSIAIIVLNLSGCQVIKKIQCDTRNWNKLGVRDGKAGRKATDSFEQYRSECTAAGTTADRASYMAGHQSGLSEFCTTANGRTEALAGRRNEQLCAVAHGDAFDTGFQQGLNEFCTPSFGRQHGMRGGLYQDTCPDKLEQEFLSSYVSALDMALPLAVSEVGVLENKTFYLQQRVRSLQAESNSYSSAIRRARKSGDEVLSQSLELSKSIIEHDLTRLKTEQAKLDNDLEKAREKSRTMSEMLGKWRLEVDIDG